MNNPRRIVLGITDSVTAGAALAINGRIVAAVNEERLIRVKMAMGWPRESIKEVLRIAGVEPQDVDQVAVATKSLFWRPEPESIKGYFEGASWGLDKKIMMKLGSVGARLFGSVPFAREPYYFTKSLLCRRRFGEIKKALAGMGVTAPIEYVDHHLAHAASAYFTGGHQTATIATLDGAGDNLAAAIYTAENGRLERVAAISSYDSIGNYYSYITHVLGFKAHRHEGKITGLAAYGKPIHADALRKLIQFKDGKIVNTGRAFQNSAIQLLRKVLPQDATREDVACSIQLVLEEVCCDFIQHWAKKIGPRHLGLAGGVVANVKLNQRLFAIPEVPSMFVHPGMGDDGLAVGAALEVASKALPVERRGEAVYEIQDVYLGPGYENSYVEEALKKAGLAYEKPENLAARVAELLHNKQVVARYSGRMEYGPRALGNRTIMVHAGDPDVNDWLNKRLQRTEFMPFAPVTLAEDADDNYIGLDGAKHSARFMTITCDCTQSLKDNCPAVVHVDGTARPQLVSDENPGYRAILEEYKKITGFSTVINTSFNMHEEPIVCTPEDAIRAFTLGHLDYLILNDCLVPHPETAAVDSSGAAVQSNNA